MSPGSHGALAHGPPPPPDRPFWAIEAEDEAGNRLDDRGGTYGPGVAGDSTEGSLMTEPPGAEVRRLPVRLTPNGDAASIWDLPALELVVHL
jgi:hypothetical protein